MLRYSLYDYSHAYILVKGNITVNNNAAAVISNSISKINNTQIDNAEYTV